MLRHIAVALALAACLWCAPASAESRLALVIGNSNYRSVTTLPNPVNDAKAIAAELKSAAFDVTQALDLGQSDMRKAIRDFAAKIASKGSDTVALVYYAGHGVQVEGENFLVPVDARIQREADIATESVRLADVMSALAAVPSKMRIVILDACRNNPFATGKQTRGLAIVDAPTGSIVAYSTAPGTEATDGTGGNSPYTTAFLEVAKQPRLQIEQMFKQVRLKVHEATNGQQTPWESSSLTSDFWFFPTNEPAPPITPAVVAATPAAPLASRLAVPQQPASPPAVSQSAPQVATLPRTPQRLAALSPPPAPEAATVSGSKSGSPPPPAATAPAFAPPSASAAVPVGDSPTPASSAAVTQIRTLPSDQAYELAVEEDTVPVYEEFLVVYPNDPRAAWVRAALALRVDAIAWRYASVVNTPAAYETYLARYPGGAYADEAMRLKLRPRLRPIDVVIAPRVIAPPPAPRIALPLLQASRPAGVPIVLPAVLSRPWRFNRAARFAPEQRLPGVNSEFGPRFNPASPPPGPAVRPALGTTAPNAFPRERFGNPYGGPSGLRRPNAIDAPAGPNAMANVPPPGRPMVRPFGPRFRPGGQRAQLGPGAAPQPPERCGRWRCRR